MGYLFRGPRLHYRRVEAGDFVGIYEIFEDWPKDRGGAYTIQRAFASVDRWLLKNKDISLPVDATSNFEECLLSVLVDADGKETFIGLTWSQIRGAQMKIMQRAIRQSMRGNGYSNDIDVDMQTYVFSVMGVSVVKFQVFSDVPQLVDKIGTRFRKDGEDVEGDKTETGKRLINAEITQTDYVELRRGQPAAEWVTFQWLGDPIPGVDIPDRVVSRSRT